MPKLQYINKRFHYDSRVVIKKANEILENYARQGYDLTLRQLYYQFVARDILPNSQASYDRLGGIVNDARLAGLIDWNHIVDRTRNLRDLSHWEQPSDIIDASASQFRIDKWATQPSRCEVWIEKDALVGVIAGSCEKWDVPYFSCRGYTSQSEMWGASQRYLEHIETGQSVEIFHFGDHDPSGIDMSRDIFERLELFLTVDYWRAHGETEFYAESGPFIREQFHLNRIALNMDQIEQYDPPPNPAKLTDSRAGGYVREYGYDSWELDALEPSVISALIESEIESILDNEQWQIASDEQVEHRRLLKAVSDDWDSIVEGR